MGGQDVNIREELGGLLKELDLLQYPAAEIGVERGQFSRIILEWNVKSLYCVDAYRTIPGQTGDGSYDWRWHETTRVMAFELLKPFWHSVHWLIGYSVEMSNSVLDNSLGFVYLDACHSYECVSADLKAWVPKLVPGGVFAMHDYLSYEGVKRAAEEFCKDKYAIHIIPDIDKAHAGAWFRV